MPTLPLEARLQETLAAFDDVTPGTPLTTAEVTERLDVGRRSTYERLDRLAEEGYLESKKVGSRGRIWWRSASVPPDGSADRPLSGDEQLFSLVDDILDRADVGVVVLDDDAEVAWVNSAAETYFGLDRDDVLGRDAQSVVRERIAPTVADPGRLAETVLSTDGGTDGERHECHVLPGEDRAERWLEHRSRSVDEGPFAGGRVELYYDVTERQRARRRVDDERRQFRSLVDAVEEYAIFLLDVDGRVQTWNTGAERIKGYDRSEVVGEHVSIFYTGADREASVPERNLARAAERGHVESEGWRVRADGTRFWANVVITALYDEQGELDGYVKVTRDMTDHRAQRRRLRAERDLSDRILEASSVAIIVLDADNRPVRVNHRTEELLGVTGAEARSFLADDVAVYDEDGEPVPPDEWPNARVLETAEPVTDWVCQMELPDGQRRWLSANAVPVFGPNDDLVRVVVTAEDITRLKEQEARLSRELDTVFERVSDAFFAVDEEWRFVYVNDRAEELLDATESELLGEPVRNAYPDLHESAFEKHGNRAMADQEPSRFEEYYPSIDAWVEVHCYPSETGLSVYLRDVTERRQRQRHLERYEAAVETVEDGIYIVDSENRFVFVNDAHVELTGYSREELLGASAELVTTRRDLERAERKRDELLAAGEESTTIETELVTKDGRRVPIETRFSVFDANGDAPGRVGVVRDITDRKERERERQTRMRQQEVVAALGQHALEAHDVDTLLRDAVERVAETLDADYCKVLELDALEQELLLREGVGWHSATVGRSTVSAVESDSQAAYTLATEDPVVVDDLETERRFTGPDLLTDHHVRSGISVVVGPVEDPWGILGVHDQEPGQFSDRDANFVQSVANILGSALARAEYEQKLIDRRGRLVALNELNAVVRDINEAVIEQSSREEIEQTVCERLAATDSYAFAWIGEVDGETATVTQTAEAGVEGYLDDITISVDPDDPLSRGPTGQALIHREMRVSQDVTAESTHDPWRDHVEAYEFRSSAAIPLVHEGNVYGVLNVYAPRPGAFAGEEREVVEQLGEVVAHAIASVERKQALLSDQLVEVEFTIRNVFEELDIDVDATGRITLDQTVPLGDGRYLEYGTATEDAVEYLEALVDRLDHFEKLSVVGEQEGTKHFELTLAEPPVIDLVAANNGYVDRGVVEDGDYHVTIHLPPTVDTREIIEAVQGSYPGTELVAHRQIARNDASLDRVRRVVADELTQRQRTALEAAFYSGYFEWPRRSTGEDVATSLGISAPTFHQHLRKALRKVVARLVEERVSPESGTRTDRAPQ